MAYFENNPEKYEQKSKGIRELEPYVNEKGEMTREFFDKDSGYILREKYGPNGARILESVINDKDEPIDFTNHEAISTLPPEFQQIINDLILNNEDTRKHQDQ